MSDDVAVAFAVTGGCLVGLLAMAVLTAIYGLAFWVLWSIIAVGLLGAAPVSFPVACVAGLAIAILLKR